MLTPEPTETEPKKQNTMTIKLKIQRYYENLPIAEKMEFLKIAKTIASQTKPHQNCIAFVRPVTSQTVYSNPLRVINAINELIKSHTAEIETLEQARDEMDFTNPLNLPRQRFVSKFELDGEKYYLVKESKKRG